MSKSIAVLDPAYAASRRKRLALMMAVLLSLSSGAEASQHLFERFDFLVEDVLNETPPAPERAGVVPVYVKTLGGSVGRSAQVELHDSAGHRLLHFEEIRGESEEPWLQPVGSLQLPISEPIRISVIAGAEARTVSRSMSLDPAVRLVQIDLLDMSTGHLVVEVNKWHSQPAAQGFVGILRSWLGWSRGARFMRYQDIESRPDIKYLSERCSKDRDWRALRTLHAMRADEVTAAQPEYWEELAGCALELGARQLAAAILSRADLRDDTVAKIGLRLAELDLDRDDPVRALSVLSELGEPGEMDAKVEAAARDLMARAYMRSGTYDLAVGVLQDGPHLSISQLWEQGGMALRSLDFLRINLGLALLRSGQTEAGRATLDMVGSRRITDPTAEYLRDHANLILGWQLLADRHGPEAAAVFDRISLNGPWADSALLARGWATVVGGVGPVIRAEVPGLSAARLEALPIRALYRRGAIGCHEVMQLLGEKADGCPGSRLFERADLPDDASAALWAALPYWARLTSSAHPGLEGIEASIAISDAFAALDNSASAIRMLDVGEKRINRLTSLLRDTERLLGDGEAPTGALTILAVLREPMPGQFVPPIAADSATLLLRHFSKNDVFEIVATYERLKTLDAMLREGDHVVLVDPALARRADTLAGEFMVALRTRCLAALDEVQDRVTELNSRLLLNRARLVEQSLR